MADALGVLSKMGYVALATWDTAYSATTGILPFLSETLSSQFSLMTNDALQGYGARLPGDQGVEVIGGTTEHNLDYALTAQFLTAVMGTNAGGVITIDDSITDTYFALEFEKQVARYRFWAAKINKITISGEKDKYCKIAIDWFAKNFEASATAFPATAQPATSLVPFDDLVFRIADQADAIAAGDAKGIESFEITFDRVYKADDYVSGATPRQPLEPVANGFRATEFGIKIPRYSVNTIAAWKDAGTALQADFTFTGPVAASIKVEFPEIRVTDGFSHPIGGPGIITTEGKFEAFRSSAANPMYTGNEMRITVT